MATKQPTSLLDLASCAVGTVIGEQALLASKGMNLKTENSDKNMDFESNIKKCAQFYDDTIPQNLHDLVTYYTLKYISDKIYEIIVIDLNVNVSDIVFRSHVTKFDCLAWHLHIEHMLHMKLPKLKDLKWLCLDLVNMRYENYVVKGIEGMIQLETFKCNAYNSNVIRVLCDNCPLKNLELCSSKRSDRHKDIDTDTLILSILKLKNLETLEINGVKISKEGQKQLLFGLPHLKNYELNLLFPNNIKSCKIIPLQKVSCCCSGIRNVTNLTKLCPLITDLTIDNYNYPLDLSNLVKLKYLTSLNVICDFYKSNIIAILETRGYQITNLGVHCENISFRTLYMIDSLCPNLVKFSLNCFSFNNEGAWPTIKSGKVFRKLESFSNTVTTGGQNLTPCLIFFLRNCLTLKEVEFSPESNLSDTDIDNILILNPLVNLQKLCIGKNNLTVQSVLKLLASCKQLMWLGCAFNGECFNRVLINFIHRNNLNVKFLSRPNHYLKNGNILSYTLEGSTLFSYTPGSRGCSRI